MSELTFKDKVIQIAGEIDILYSNIVVVSEYCKSKQACEEIQYLIPLIKSIRLALDTVNYKFEQLFAVDNENSLKS